jgi:hypothetical protein
MKAFKGLIGEEGKEMINGILGLLMPNG